MLSFRHKTLFAIILCCTFVSVSCAAEKPAVLAHAEAGMKACPTSPNCVSSDARDENHYIAPLTFSIPVAEAWQLLKEQVAKLPRSVVVNEKSGYLHVECRSAVFGFVDDLEFYLRDARGLIDVRSAARSGYYDFGANRQRVEELRAALNHAGIGG